jgi:DNA-binding response OmpR family regulator
MLVVEDDPDVGMGLKDFFELKGYDVTSPTTVRRR